jgi:coenzyme F420-dependent glucose-6-phosphate dehydrogenase
MATNKQSSAQNPRSRHQGHRRAGREAHQTASESGENVSRAMRWGYTCSSEEFEASELARLAVEAEETGFEFVTVSDHFNPWTSTQGHSPFAWSTVGAIAALTNRVGIGTGVTCPLIRYHPAVIAQAAATSAELSGGRFFLGVGTGEALNEHITGDRWPPADLRLEMLVEAVTIMRALWTGDNVDHEGDYYVIENARLYSLPDDPPAVYWAAAGEQSATLAGQHADGLWATSPSAQTVAAYRKAGGKGDVIGQLTLCYGTDRNDAIATAHRVWPNAAIPGQLSQDLPTPTHFEQAAELVTPEVIARHVLCGDDTAAVVKAVTEYAEAGFTMLHFHQIGADQDGFVDWWKRELADAVAKIGS